MSFKKTDFFWPSYSDLMTSLFFIMLVLYILTFVKLKIDQHKYITDAEKFRKIQEIENAIGKLDTNYFHFDKNNKRYKLQVDVKFVGGEYELPTEYKSELQKAGELLFKLMEELKKEAENVNYLLIIEGNTQRTRMSSRNGNWNYKEIPNVGYNLSYKRALALYNFWKQRNYDFRNFEHCEVLISGSGYFGKSREPFNHMQGKDPEANRRFTIQITPKIGQLTDQINE